MTADRVLLIDDDPRHALALEKALCESRAAAPTLAWVRSLARGLDRLGCTDVSAVFLSLALPDGRGAAAIERVLSTAPLVPLILLGGVDDEDVCTAGMARGAEDYLLEGHVDTYAFARTLRQMTERATARAMAVELSHRVQHDALTDLPNRTLLRERLGQAVLLARRHHHHLAVIYLDIDGFKQVNDSLGHAIGDELLKSIAVRLAACVRKSDTVSRQGGDEFVVLLSELSDGADAGTTAEKILAELKRTYRIGDHRLGVTASLGISVFPEHGDEVDTLLRNADTAMYHAKAKGRDGYHCCDRDMVPLGTIPQSLGVRSDPPPAAHARTSATTVEAGAGTASRHQVRVLSQRNSAPLTTQG